MSQYFSTDEIDCMADTAVAHMQDSGHIWTLMAGAVDAYGVPAAKYNLGPKTVCGINFDHKTFENLGETDVSNVEAQVRLPKTAVLTSSSCFRLTSRFGQPLEVTYDFEVVGQPRLGPDSLLADLALITDGRFDSYD